MIPKFLQATRRRSARPAAGRLEKIEAFTGSLPTRDLYIYLPPGYDSETRRHYPLLYLHDGQNCFEAFKEDSYAGVTWAADLTADQMILNGQMRPCIIVGVSNGREHRMREYLPPYATWQPPTPPDAGIDAAPPDLIKGMADKTFSYYQKEIDPFIREHYRVLTGRNQTATCGSSMGGLFSTYIAWEFPEFARHHAALSASYWITERADGKLEIAERARKQEPRQIRLYLDSGTQDSPGKGDDNSPGVRAVRDSLCANNFAPGPQLQYFLDEGGIHHESAWAARLPQVFRFLFPPVNS